MRIKKANSISKSACIFALIAMGVCGLGYRATASYLERADSPISLPVSLASLPMTIDNWTGKDVLLSDLIAKAARNDDFCNRVYVNRKTDYQTNVYIAYSGRPRTMLGHRPDVCYVGAGWILESTIKSEFISQSGRQIPCLIHRFHTPEPRRQELVVLSFYIVNGIPSNDESVFSGMGWRRPHINGSAARYVAQVQINSFVESAVREMAGDLADTVLSFFPDGNGKISTAHGDRSDGITLK